MKKPGRGLRLHPPKEAEMPGDTCLGKVTEERVLHSTKSNTGNNNAPADIRMQGVKRNDGSAFDPGQPCFVVERQNIGQATAN